LTPAHFSLSMLRLSEDLLVFLTGPYFPKAPIPKDPSILLFVLLVDLGDDFLSPVFLL